MKGTKNELPAEYARQPAYNENYIPSLPPSYAEAVGTTTPYLPASNTVGGAASPYLPNSNTVSVALSVGPKPCKVMCPNCHAEVVTRVNTTYQKSAHIACFILCIICCCLCSCIPYCLQAFKNINHTCPNCKGFVGTYKN